MSRPYVATQSSNPLPLLSLYSILYSDTIPAKAIPQSQNNKCIETQTQPSSLLLCNTKPIHCTTKVAIQLSVLQYNFPAVSLSLAIQTEGCNTIFFFTTQLGSSLNQFSAHFFFRFSPLFFFHLFPAAGKIT